MKAKAKRRELLRKATSAVKEQRQQEYQRSHDRGHATTSSIFQCHNCQRYCRSRARSDCPHESLSTKAQDKISLKEGDYYYYFYLCHYSHVHFILFPSHRRKSFFNWLFSRCFLFAFERGKCNFVPRLDESSCLPLP